MGTVYSTILLGWRYCLFLCMFQFFADLLTLRLHTLHSLSIVIPAPNSREPASLCVPDLWIRISTRDRSSVSLQRGGPTGAAGHRVAPHPDAEPGAAALLRRHEGCHHVLHRLQDTPAAGECSGTACCRVVLERSFGVDMVVWFPLYSFGSSVVRWFS